MSTAVETAIPQTDEDRAALMVRLVKETLHADTAEGRAGIGAILRELRHADPEAIERLAAGIQIARAGLRAGATTH
ncbi:hypothetical protein [Brevundimonas viscosa]|uniref:hypothetical protein n=1 Tax=Brevundimonas viscosa TaxID=871741 RepID=UPI000B893026|nr:hypothetical protein [Brevundimonas viscosa]